MRPPVYLIGLPDEILRLNEWCHHAGWKVVGDGVAGDDFPDGCGLLAVSLPALVGDILRLGDLVEWCRRSGSFIATLSGVDTWGGRAGGVDQLRALVEVMQVVGASSSGAVQASVVVPVVRGRRTSSFDESALAAVTEFVIGGGPHKSVRALARSLNVSPMTAKKWVLEVEKEGVDQ